MSTPSTPRLALLAALLAGCSDARLPTAAEPVPAPAEITAPLDCTVRIREQSVQCNGPALAPGLSPVILGGQGEYVQLTNWRVAYDSVSGIFETDVSLWNLLSQPLGSRDGVTPEGFKIFFFSGPTATAGHGNVRVENPDGLQLFLGAPQPYFQYETVRPMEHSTRHPWVFKVDPGVEAFSFSVYIQAVIPGPRAVLQVLAFQTVRSMHDLTRAGDALVGVHTRAYTDIPTVIYRSTDRGATWSAHNVPPVVRREFGCPTWFYQRRWVPSLWAADGDRLFAVENSVFFVCTAADTVVRNVAGVLRSADGGRTWVRIPRNGILRNDLVLEAIWGSGADDLYAAGHGYAAARTGYVIHSRDGFQTYTVRTVGGPLRGIWGSGPRHVIAVGGVASRELEGFIALSIDGGVRWLESWIPGMLFEAVWGTGEGHVWAVGRQRLPGVRDLGVVLHSADGGFSWQVPPLPGGTQPLEDLWGTDAGNVYAVGEEGEVLHFNGELWWSMWSRTRADFHAVEGLVRDTFFIMGELSATGVR